MFPSGGDGIDFSYPDAGPASAQQRLDFFTGNTSRSLNVVNDRYKAFAGLAVTPLMEFLFYKKRVGSDDERLSKTIAKMFYEEEGIDPANPALLDKIIEAIKTNHRSSPKIKAIFVAAARELGIPVSHVKDLNITALSMLHRNREQDILRFVFGSDRRAEKANYSHFKLEALRSAHFTTHSKMIPVPIYYLLPGRAYPNTLLTSDGFFKKLPDVNAFKAKYRHYLTDCWLVQVPHHGAKRNISQEFYDLFDRQLFFINYGVDNTHGHPTKETFDLMPTYVWIGPVLINEHAGFVAKYLISDVPL